MNPQDPVTERPVSNYRRMKQFMHKNGKGLATCPYNLRISTLRTIQFKFKPFCHNCFKWSKRIALCKKKWDRLFMFHMATGDFRMRLAARNGVPVAADECQECGSGMDRGIMKFHKVLNDNDFWQKKHLLGGSFKVFGQGYLSD